MAGEQQDVRIWKVPTGNESTMELLIEEFMAHSPSVNSVQYSPDGSKIVTCGNDRSIKIWDGESSLPPLTQPFANCHSVLSWAWA